MKTAKFIVVLAGLATVHLSYADGDASEGKALYRNYCTQCHGVTGDGKGVNIPDMAVLPRDHTDTSEMSARTDAELTKAIKHGGKAVNKSVLMPAWEGNLNDQQVANLVAYLRELCCNK
ncbi:MAG: cytochrome C class I [Spongiibacteraceae bacterium]|nr:cytochrome C class I [Spongiibacteraceae bacterium]|tara:strand:- start:2637 stop:2993 length:357 start_codon:yes stop_codon:yes gene_type:complete